MKNLFLFLLMACSASIFSQNQFMDIELYVDLETEPQSSLPEPRAVFDDRLIFVAENYGYAKELWISDGSEQGTYAIHQEINKYGGLYPIVETSENDIYFLATTDEDVPYGFGFSETEALFHSDGTRGLPTKIYHEAYKEEIIEVAISENGAYFWVRNDCSQYNDCDKLYFTDGTEPGTSLVLTEVEGDTSYTILGLHVLENKTVILARNSEADFILSLDGPSSTPVLMQEFERSSLVDFGSTDAYVFYSDKDELWSTDGTNSYLQPALTFKSTQSDLYFFRDNKFYYLGDGEDNIIWVSEGPTSEIYVNLEEIVGFTGNLNIYPRGEKIYLAYSFTDYLYGPNDGIQKLPGQNDVLDVIHSKGEYYLWTRDAFYNFTDDEDTIRIADIHPYDDITYSFDSGLYFIQGEEVYLVENNQLELIIQGDQTGNYDISSTHMDFTETFAEANGRVFFANDDSIHGYELWSTLGNQGSAAMVKNINSGTNGHLLNQIRSVDSTLYVSVGEWNRGTAENGLYQVNPYTKTASKIFDFKCFIEQAGDYMIVVSEIDSQAFQQIYSVAKGDSILQLLGSAPSTVLTSTVPHTEMYPYGDKVLINSEAGLTITDGTQAGTFSLTDESIDREYFVFKDIAYFTTARYTNSGSNVDLWRTDGTVDGTYMLLENTTGENRMEDFTVYKDYLLFNHADRIYYTDGNNLEFEWSNDLDHIFSTNEVLYAVKDGFLGILDWHPNVGGSGNSHSSFLDLNHEIAWLDKDFEGFLLDGRPYLAVDQELFSIDGTPEGTQLIIDNFWVRDILGEYEGILYFSRETEETGRELWASDGTVEGTFLVEDLFITEVVVSSIGADPWEIYIFHDQVLMLARDQKYGNSRREVFLVNNFYKPDLTGTVFEDLNDDGVQNVGEKAISGMAVELLPDGKITYSNSEGVYGFDIDDHDRSYEVRVLPHYCWEPKEDKVPVANTTNNANFTSSYSADLGMTSLASDRLDFDLDFTTSIARCNTKGKHWLSFENIGCESYAGKIEATFDHRDTILQIDATFDSLRNVYTFIFDDLPANERFESEIILRRPNETFTGDTLKYSFKTFIEMNGSYEEVKQDSAFQILNCAYDPNDKQVTPAREEASNSNYTQFDESLKYKIRFQNTGNDTAFNIVIRDTLSPMLDHRTVRSIRSSHQHTTELDGDGVISFYFDNIYLPDSLINEPESHGYVSFYIDAKEEIMPFDSVFNTAYIYFDLNQPIITNTVKSTFVEFLDEDEDGFNFYEECDDQNASINPSAMEISGNNIDEDCDGVIASTHELQGGTYRIFPNPAASLLSIESTSNTQYEVVLMTSFGLEILKGTNLQQIDLSHFSSGSYLVRVINSKTGDHLVQSIVKIE